jgi:ribosome-associated heat shock protein Hsp15
MHDPAEPVRVDRWIWAARLAKTRPLAAEAVAGGRVTVNGQRIKPGKPVKPGDRLEITVGDVRREVLVRATAPRRVSATEAAALYDETPESAAARERAAAQRRLAAAPAPERGAGRPTKRDRRRFDRARRG